MKLPVPPVLRALNRDDMSERNLVLAGWLRTYTDASAGVERAVFFRMAEPVVKALVERSEVTLACLHDEPSAIYGWIAVEGDVLHYVVTKPRWQRLGIASWLLAHQPKLVAYTHRTAAGMRLAVGGMEYRPMRRFEEAA